MIRGGKRVMSRSDSRSNRPAIEIADILRRHGDAYRRVHAGHLGRVERRVMSAIVACRTEALGGHVEACDDCGTTRVAYNSCRNRHCPKCQGRARAAWLAARQADLLPVPYFHVVFTLPAPIAAIAFQNKAVVYAILFKAAAEAMTTLAANPRRLGGAIGGVAVLHTWEQARMHHPHVHCVVPSGGFKSEHVAEGKTNRPECSEQKHDPRVLQPTVATQRNAGHCSGDETACTNQKKVCSESDCRVGFVGQKEPGDLRHECSVILHESWLRVGAPV